MNKYDVELGLEVVADLERYARCNHVSKAEAFKRALALLQIAFAQAQLGHQLGVIHYSKDGSAQVVGIITGITKKKYRQK